VKENEVNFHNFKYTTRRERKEVGFHILKNEPKLYQNFGWLCGEQTFRVYYKEKEYQSKLTTLRSMSLVFKWMAFPLFILPPNILCPGAWNTPPFPL
jgi:hypothetical protein